MSLLDDAGWTNWLGAARAGFEGQLTAELARVTGARHFEVMKGMGHFPMSESPVEFRRYLTPVLDRIAAGG